MTGWFKPSSYYECELIRTKGKDDALVDNEVRNVLLLIRWRHTIEPWVRCLKVPVNVLKVWYGRYRESRSKVHGGAAQASGASAGAFRSAAPPALWASPVLGTVTLTAAGAGYPGVTEFEDAGIIAGEVTAYRSWVLHRDGLLHSVIMSSFAWTPGGTAEGEPTGFGGIYAFKDKDKANYLGNTHTYEGDNYYPVVTGTVEMWGEVYEHERGYRASKARIASIDDSPHYDAEKLRKLYKLNRSTARRSGKRKPKGEGK